jgi:hypothetical protein
MCSGIFGEGKSIVEIFSSDFKTQPNPETRDPNL